MGFIKAIPSSIYSPAFYESIIKNGLGRAFGYFFLLITLLTIFSTAPLVYSFATEGQPEIKNGIANVSQNYPDELEVKIVNGQVSTNVEEPYIIPSPEGFDSEESSNLIVIDTVTPFSASQFEEYNTVAWLSKDIIYIKGNGNEFRAYQLNDIENLTVNKTSVAQLASTITPWVDILTPILGVFIFLGFFIAYSFRLVYMFFLALCIFLLTKIMKRPLTYKTSYKIGLYAVTLSFIIEIIQRFESTLRIPFLFTIVALIVVFINLRHLKTSHPK